VEIRFLAPELRHLDALKCEAILTPFFSDERPFAGALGLLDWRLCGMLSRAMQRGVIHGARGETVLVPLRPRLGVDKLFLFGLGPEAEFSRDAQRPTTARMLEVVTRAKVRTAAFVLPGRSTGCVEASDAIENFFAAATPQHEQDEIVVIEPPEAQRSMEPIVQRERRRARATGA
jgi:Cytosol aminopeptidase family, N-terminal domain